MRYIRLLVFLLATMWMACQSGLDSDDYTHHPDDIAFLQHLINLNGLTEASSALDRNNGDGILAPLEVGFQEWENKRLTILRLSKVTDWGPPATIAPVYDIKALPESIGKVENLIAIYIPYTSLKELPDAICELDSLRILQFFGNDLERLPERIGEMTSLSGLYVAANALESLPASFAELDNLRNLDLSRNNFQRLPDFFCELPMLYKLELTANRLEALPEGIGNIPHLFFLHVEDNELSELPESITNVRRTYVEQNKLYCVDGAQDTTRIPAMFIDTDGTYRVEGLFDQDCSK